ncbi:MAG: UDP-N-acetylmuramoylalanine--D-glutamate ligase [Planctomycetota bacterium]|jgi:UDP-N-acetylmuramoylalanine--D-glutamate ligase
MSTQVSGSSVTIMGLGLFGGGVSCARWFAARGARVTVTDLRDAQQLAPSIEALAGLDIRYVLGRHDENDFHSADIVVANPAVPPSNPLLEVARQSGAQITSEMALALRSTRARIALITGTQGKSSSATFATQLLRASGFDAQLLGNVGRPVLDVAESLTPDSIAIVEISSYQLEALAEERSALEPMAEVVAITNIRVDHLERHGSTESYAAAKLSILRHRKRDGWAIYDARDSRISAQLDEGIRTIAFSDPDCASDASRQATLRIHMNRVWVGGECLASLAELPLAGDFQRENVARALAIAFAFGATPARLTNAISDLKGLPHRLEDLGTFGGRRVIDNGVSTTPDSTLAAVCALPELAAGDQVLLGGRCKAGLSFIELACELARRRIAAVCFGADAERIADQLRAATDAGRPPTMNAPFPIRVECVADTEAAVQYALDSGARTILFSPAAASFDAFPNFQARALHFRQVLRDHVALAPSLTAPR